MRRRPPRQRVVVTPLGRRALPRVHLVETPFLDLVRLLEERRESEEDRTEDGADGQRVEACVAARMLIEEVPHVRARKPPRLPRELIRPMPAAAAYPVMYSVGSAQKIGCIATKPIAASEGPAMAITGVPLIAPESQMPKAVTRRRLLPISRC